MADTPKDAMTAAEVIENALDELEGYCESCRCDAHTMCAAHRAKQAILAALRGPGHPEPPAERRGAMLRAEWDEACYLAREDYTKDPDTLRAERAQRNGDDTGWLVETKQGDTFTDVDVYDDGDVIVSTGGKNVPPRSVRVSELWAERDRLKEALRELVATVRGECPSILNEDSGGNAALDLRIDALLTPTPTPETPASTKER